ncbi:hypothetical protein E2C01_047970 [Portunus trituberculatus]|uniref:Uncharacterized protein n=1 Tax=Portunus trituberculatus TaxID=210409 RepID=A0A5B7G9Y5_PORTR|nr:hypothetical protein [Portunus trituberculatus]
MGATKAGTAPGPDGCKKMNVMVIGMDQYDFKAASDTVGYPSIEIVCQRTTCGLEFSIIWQASGPAVASFGRFNPYLAFPDDVALLATIPMGLKHAVADLVEAAARLELEVGVVKCTTIRIRADGSRTR